MGEAKRREKQKQADLTEARSIARDQFAYTKENYGYDYNKESVQSLALLI